MTNGSLPNGHTVEKAGPHRGKVRVLLADQSPALRREVRKSLQELPAIEIVGEAGSDNEALRLCFQLEPGVLVLSTSLPEQGGFEVLRRIKRTMTRCDVVLMSSRPCSFVEKAATLLGATAVCPIE